MEAVGAAASIIAMIDLTAKFTKLCKAYIRDVKNAEAGELALCDRILATGKLAKEVDGLIHGPDKDKLESSADMEGALLKCQNILEEKLKPRGRTRLKQLVKTLKRPLDKTEINKAVGNLKALEDTIQFAIKLDGLKVVLCIDKTVDRIAAAVGRIAGLPVAEGISLISYSQI
ncbi:uncharacterized protein DFL_001495 [Arthrobotrys flagrans]|uniref:Uncharacterized protein n=1 Tax=Arthrobotrys flagrans TaxID=97331 RepID=A0A437A7S3_ARTFL|nr:hypothetical protein DFL_001495 [Arthrobotrys flagrans]